MFSIVTTRKVPGATGSIFNVQRFSLHDGPGIRTVVFFKGCPLRCLWCSNPESWNRYPELTFDAGRCIHCQKCLSLCAAGAISVKNNVVELAKAKCDNCLKCVGVCPAEALAQVGRTASVKELVTEIEKDALFYENSGGGVTASGGEPLFQPRFLQQLFKACKDKAISTALETSGFTSLFWLKRVLRYTDLVLFDIKHMDAREHKRLTGKSNELIITNMEYAASAVRTWLRFPLIPGYNDSDGNLESTARFAARIGVDKVSLLPYHSWGAIKYSRLGMEYCLDKVQPPDDAKIERAKSILEKSGKEVTIGW